MYYFPQSKSSKPKSEKKRLLFLTSQVPRNWDITQWVTPQGPKYAQEPWKGSDLPQATKKGHISRENLKLT